MKKPTKTMLIKKCDTLWAKIVKARAGNKCEICGKTDMLNSHHIFSRSNMRMRHNLKNGVCLCVSHHVWGGFSAHKSPIEFIEHLKYKRGDRWYKELRDVWAMPPAPITIQYYQAMLEGLKQTYDESTRT